MELVYSPDLVAVGWRIAAAAVFFALAVIVSVRRRDRGRSPGAATMVLLVLAALALFGAWSAYFPSCPRNMWC